MKRKTLPFLAIALGALFLSSCGMLPSKGLTPGKLPKGGQEIAAEELGERFFDSVNVFSTANDVHGSFNLTNFDYTLSSAYEDSCSKMSDEMVLDVSGNLEFGMKDIFSSIPTITTGYVKVSGLNFKTKQIGKNLDKQTGVEDEVSLDYNYSGISLDAYLYENKAYINLENDAVKSLITDMIQPEYTEEQKETFKNTIPTKIVTPELFTSSVGGLITSEFVFTEESKSEFVEYLGELKNAFGDSISYLAYGDKGYGVSFSISQDKFFDYYLELNGISKENLTELEKENYEQLKKAFYDDCKFDTFKASVYFDVDNKKIEEAIDINFQIKSKYINSYYLSESLLKLACKVSSTVEFGEKEIEFPSNLSSYIPTESLGI